MAPSDMLEDAGLAGGLSSGIVLPWNRDGAGVGSTALRGGHEIFSAGGWNNPRPRYSATMLK